MIIRATCAVGVLFALAAGAALVLSHLFNTGVIGRNFQTDLETRYHISAKRVSIGFRPFPVVALREVRATIPETLDGTVGTVFIHLHLLPLFAGRISPAAIELQNPVVTLRLHHEPAVPPEATPSQKLAGFVKWILRPQAPLLVQMEHMAILARGGALKIFVPSGRSFFFEHIDFDSSAKNRAVDFRLVIGQSSFWQTFELKGLVDPYSLKGSGELNVTGGNPENIAGCLYGSGPCRLGGSLADITAALFYSGPGNFRADFTASAPSFVFGLGTHSMTIKEGFLAGLLIADAKTVQLSISDLRFDQPHINLTASCTEKFSDGSFSLAIDGRRTDAATLRSILLAVNRKDAKGTEDFFEILRAAQVPEIHFSSRANDLSGLFKLENMTLKCPIEKGVVLAPKTGLLVSNVSADVLIKNSVLTATRISGKTRGSSTRGGELTIGLPHDNPLFHLDLPVEADLSELPAVLNHLATKDGAFEHELAQIGGVTGKTRGRLVIGENLQALEVKVSTGRFYLSCRYGRLPGPVSLDGASFDMDGDKIGFTGVDAALADSTLSVSGGLRGFLGRHPALDLQLKGRLGPEGNKIAASLAGLPSWLKPISRTDLLASTLTWEKGAKTTFNGKMQLSGGPLVEADVVETPVRFDLRRLTVKDNDSDAEIGVSSLQDGFRIGFSGALANKTAVALLNGNWPFKGPVSGKFQADFYPGSPQKSSGYGQITLSDFQVPCVLPPSSMIEKATVEAGGKKLVIKSAVATWKGSRLNLTGGIDVTGAGYRLDMNASTERLDIDSILKSEWITGKARGKPGPLRLCSPEKTWDMPLTGVVRVKSGQLSYGGLIWAPAEGDVTINQGSADIRLTRAKVCGISTPGKILVTPAGAHISLDISAGGKDLQSSLACFFHERELLSGSYRLSGHVEAKMFGKVPAGPQGFAPSLEGQVEFKANDGRIFRFNAFTKIISLLSISEIYRGVVPNLIAKGCPYKTLLVKGTIKNGMLVLSDSVLDGPSIKMVFSGQVDLVKRQLNVTALVAPQRTVERVVNATPFMGRVLKDAFITVPVGVSGNLADPSVVLLSPGAVGHEILGVMQRLVKFPTTIFQPQGNSGSPAK